MYRRCHPPIPVLGGVGFELSLVLASSSLRSTRKMTLSKPARGQDSSRLKTRDGLARTGGMPDKSTVGIPSLFQQMPLPPPLAVRAPDRSHQHVFAVLLVACFINDEIIAHQLMRHRNHEELGNHLLPVVHRLVMSIRPMKDKAGIKWEILLGVAK